MMNNLDDLIDNTPILQGQLVTANSIELSPEQVALAAELSASAEPEALWQIYLNQLALIGIEEWLKEQVPELEIKQDRRRQTGYLTVGDFNLFVIPLDLIEEDVVSVSKAAIDKSELRPHLYVLVKVLAESRLVFVYGCLSQLRLLQQREIEATRIENEDDVTYLLPLDWFELDPDQVLLYLRCIYPSALTSQPIVDKVSVTSPTSSVVQSVTSGISRITEKVDQAVQELTLIWQPRLQLGSIMRSQPDEDNIATIISELQDKGMEIPLEYNHGYSENFLWQDVSLRLHIIKWNLANTISSIPKWSLLLILGASDEKALPPELTIKVEDTEQNLLFENVVPEGTQHPYLYSQVVGTWQECFKVTIQMHDKSKFTTISFDS